MYRANGEVDKAIRDYSRAIELNPRHTAALKARSKAYEARGEFSRADEDWKAATGLGPQ